MSMYRYGADGSNLTLMGIPIDDFGDTDPPIRISDLEQRSTLKRGIGRTSVRLDNQTLAKRVEVYLMPGSPQVRQILAAAKSGVDATFSLRQSGANEMHAGFDGILVNRGSVDRGGKTTVSDEVLTFEFSDGDET